VPPAVAEKVSSAERPVFRFTEWATRPLLFTFGVLAYYITGGLWSARPTLK